MRRICNPAGVEAEMRACDPGLLRTPGDPLQRLRRRSGVPLPPSARSASLRENASFLVFFAAFAASRETRFR